MDRRRFASTLAIVFAAGSSLATTQTAPTPPPSAHATVDGSVELSPDSPVAVQELRVEVVGPGISSGRHPSVSFSPTGTARDPGGAKPRLRVVRAGDASGGATASHDADPETGNRLWDLSCTANEVCSGRFALIVESEDRSVAATALIDWNVDAGFELWGGVAAGQPTVSLVAEEVDVTGIPTLEFAMARGEPVRFDVRNRMAQWRVRMTLGEEGIDQIEAAAGWPIVSTGWLTTTKSVASETASGEDPGDALAFIHPVGDVSGFEPRNGKEAIEFEPFSQCLEAPPDTKCTAEYVIGLNFGDPREGSAIDAGWNLEVRAIGADGKRAPVKVDVEPVGPIPTAVGTAKGRLVWNEQTRGEFRYTIDVPRPAVDDGSWDGLDVPSYGIVRATLTSTGREPLPPDFAVNFGRHGGEGRLTVAGGPTTFGFTPLQDRGCRMQDLATCSIERNLAAGFSTENLPRGWEFTIDWELEIGVGTTDPAGGTLEIVETPRPSPSK